MLCFPLGLSCKVFSSLTCKGRQFLTFLLSLSVAVMLIRQATNNLLKLGIIREDGRSIREGLPAWNEKALFYTEKEMRELVDMLEMRVI